MIVFSKKLKITECCPKHFLTMHSVVSQTEIKMININETNKKHCCGCTACESVCHKKCISMQTDNEGFKYPVVDKTKCVNCRLCEKVCPILNKTHNVFPNTAYIVRNKNSEIVRSSTSGGAVTAFSKEIINNGESYLAVHLTVTFMSNIHTLKQKVNFQNSKFKICSK